MTDFNTMVERVGRELLRTGATWTQSIKDAINDAIKLVAVERFYFNEVVGQTFNTVADQETYGEAANALLPGMSELDILYYTVGSDLREVCLTNHDEMNRLRMGTPQTGEPERYSLFGEQLFLYPIPAAVYPMTFDGFGRLTPHPLTDNTDTNAWMTEGEMLIRAAAKAIFSRDVASDFKKAAAFEEIAEQARMTLAMKSSSRASTGTIKATKW